MPFGLAFFSQHLHKCLLFVCESGALEMDHGGVDEGEVVEHGLVHTVDHDTVCDGKSRLLVYELLIEVTTVTC